MNNSTGEQLEIDITNLPFLEVWDTLNLTNKEIKLASKIEKLYYNSPSVEELKHLPKSFKEKHDSSSHYHTREELENIVGDSKIVEKLIWSGILKLHPKWNHLKNYKKGKGEIQPSAQGNSHLKHPQSPYKLDYLLIELLATNSKYTSKDFCRMKGS